MRKFRRNIMENFDKKVGIFEKKEKNIKIARN